MRVRKEGQVYSAEEKRALQMLDYEEKRRRESQMLSDFRQLVQSKIGGNQVGPTAAPTTNEGPTIKETTTNPDDAGSN